MNATAPASRIGDAVWLILLDHATLADKRFALEANDLAERLISSRSG